MTVESDSEEDGKEENAGQPKPTNSTRNFIIAVVGVICVLGLVVGAGYWYSSSEMKPYNNFPFEKDGQLWITQAQMNGQPYTLPFYYHPTDLEDIPAPKGVEQPLVRAGLESKNMTVFITLDPDLPSKAIVAGVEISRLTGSKYDILNLRTHGALTRAPENPDASAPRPIVTCSEASANGTMVIKMRLGQNNVISQRENGCIVLEGETPEDLKSVADRFAYMILGIMD